MFLCVKPDQIPDTIEEISGRLEGSEDAAGLISMAAGVSLATMEESVSAAGSPIVRVMPNTPMLVGKGVLAVCYGRFVTDEQSELVRRLLGAAGLVVVGDGAMGVAVAAVCGAGEGASGLGAEALVDAGVSLGLPRELAQQLAGATAAGAGAMLEQGTSPVELRASVSSPAGTTVAANRECDVSGLRGAGERATEACAQRATQLG